MKKFMNKPADYVDEMLDGLTAAHPALERAGASRRVVRRSSGMRRGKVGVVSGGGSGHLPLFTGYVGHGLLDSCAIGNVFEGPNLQSCMEAIEAADGGSGVLCLFGNYGGDRMNFEMASEMLEDAAIVTRTVLGADDIASAGPDEAAKRRGVAGLIFAYKTAGAMAESGADLDEVARIAAKTGDLTRTIGVALAPCRVPTAAAPTFALGPDEIEMGMGIHGEPGIWRDRLKPADELVDEMLERLIADRPAKAGERVVVLVNGLGATPLEELYIAYRRVAARLGELRIEIAQPLVGSFVTSMEMAGASISLCFVDDELEALMRAPAACPFWSVA